MILSNCGYKDEPLRLKGHQTKFPRSLPDLSHLRSAYFRISVSGHCPPPYLCNPARVILGERKPADPLEILGERKPDDPLEILGERKPDDPLDNKAEYKS